jgi:hypothetical protein
MREKCGFIAVPHTVAAFKWPYPQIAQVRPWADSKAKLYAGQFMLYEVPGSLRKIFYETSKGFSSLIYLCHSNINIMLRISIKNVENKNCSLF